MKKGTIFGFVLSTDKTCLFSNKAKKEAVRCSLLFITPFDNVLQPTFEREKRNKTTKVSETLLASTNMSKQ